MKITIVLQIAFITLSASCFLAKGQNSLKSRNEDSQAQPKIVTLCNLVNEPDKFQNKIVKVKTIFFSNYESAGLYDPKCNKKDNVVWLDMNCENSLEKCSKINNTLSKIPYSNANGGKERKVLLNGIFRTAKSSNKRFGVNLRAKYAIELIEIENSSSPN